MSAANKQVVRRIYDVSVRVNDTMAEGDKVAVYYTTEGTNEGDFRIYDNASLMEQLSAGPG